METFPVTEDTTEDGQVVLETMDPREALTLVADVLLTLVADVLLTLVVDVLLTLVADVLLTLVVDVLLTLVADVPHHLTDVILNLEKQHDGTDKPLRISMQPAMTSMRIDPPMNGRASSVIRRVNPTEDFTSRLELSRIDSLPKCVFERNLRSHIRLGCGVEKADKNGDKWEVVVEDGTKYIGNNLVMCTEVHQRPNRDFESTMFAEYSGLAWVCHWTTAGSLLAYQGHGIPEWKNDADFFHFFINKNGHVLDLVDYEQVVPKGAIDAVKDKTVFFSDGCQAEVDVVITCTGYRKEFPFLPPQYQIPLPNNYKFIFNVEDPSIAFVGYVRPIVGSIPVISEIQAWFTARVFSGSARLPENGDILNETNQDKEFWANYFKDSSHRLDTLVEVFTYLDIIAEKAGIRVSYVELFKSSPRDWFTAVLAPGCASTFRLSVEKDRQKALNNLKRRGEACISDVVLILILFCRFFWFDWWLIQFGKIKYMFQTNRFCKKIQKWPAVRFIDWIWTTPKRWLFDNKTRS
ncbi:hypothetical protein QZH41_001316 [Actinostola sp. cb2023]|nr:hypothetical protein QZH41_001316 [Actinostola sp. cb2023]